MTSKVLANLGFLLQISGILTVLPIVVGFIFGETQAIISLLLTCVVFFVTGFFLNSLCEKKELDFVQSHFLFLIIFLILPLIGTIPYLYLSFNLPSVGIFESFTNGVFESVSGFTTTGFSFVEYPELLPNSIRLYRSLTELMGGVGLVFLLITFFQSRRTLENLSKSVGIENINGNLKKSYFTIFGLYGLGILIFIVLFLIIGFTNPIDTITYVIDTLTGGFAPSAIQFQEYLAPLPKLLTVLLMLFGAVNFASIYSLFKRKIKEALTEELFFFFIIIFIGAILVSLAGPIDFFDSFYHVVSLSTSVGFNYIPITSFGETSFSILIVIMLIGGCTFSLAGGVRISRILSFAKESKTKIGEIFREEYAPPDLSTKEIKQTLPAGYFIIIYVLTLVVFAIIYTNIGTSFSVALFEVGSALSTTGITIGTISILMPLGYKWLIIMIMIIGRVEILSIIIVVFALLKKIPIELPSFSKFLNIVEKILVVIKDLLKSLLSRFKR